MDNVTSPKDGLPAYADGRSESSSIPDKAYATILAIYVCDPIKAGQESTPIYARQGEAPILDAVLLEPSTTFLELKETVRKTYDARGRGTKYDELNTRLCVNVLAKKFLENDQRLAIHEMNWPALKALLQKESVRLDLFVREIKPGKEQMREQVGEQQRGRTCVIQ